MRTVTPKNAKLIGLVAQLKIFRYSTDRAFLRTGPLSFLAYLLGVSYETKPRKDKDEAKLVLFLDDK